MNTDLEGTGVYKGIPGFRRRSQELLLGAAENSVYHW